MGDDVWCIFECICAIDLQTDGGRQNFASSLPNSLGCAVCDDWLCVLQIEFVLRVGIYEYVAWFSRPNEVPQRTLLNWNGLILHFTSPHKSDGTGRLPGRRSVLGLAGISSQGYNRPALILRTPRVDGRCSLVIIGFDPVHQSTIQEVGCGSLSCPSSRDYL